MFVLIKTLEEIDRYEDAWRQLARGAPSPIQGFGWSRAWSTRMGRDGVRIAFLGTPDRPLAIGPLAEDRSRWPRRLELLGSRALGEPTDLLWSSQEALEQLAGFLVRLGEPLSLRRIPEHSRTPEALRKAFRFRGIVLCRPDLGCPYIPLDESWKEPEQHLNARRRSDLRRARRRAEALGAVSTEVLSPRPHELEALLERGYAVEAKSWKGVEGTALAVDATRGAFFKEYARRACEEGILRLCFLSIADRPVATQIAVEHGSGFWLLKIGYDAEFSRCSPGNLLLAETIGYAATKGLKSYEFLGTVESWTRVWTTRERRCQSLRAYPVTLRGMAALAEDGFAWLGRRIRRRPPSDD
jgi:CelD/BcsL family acetyltransferase involved in cellulose biosynthesis